jgi:hypothetical protein
LNVGQGVENSVLKSSVEPDLSAGINIKRNNKNMPAYPFDLNHIITNEAFLRSLLHDQHQLAKQKYQSRLDIHSRQFIEQSPFVFLGTQNLDGKADVSPHGDPVGFVKTLEWDIMLTNEWG